MESQMCLNLTAEEEEQQQSNYHKVRVGDTHLTMVGLQRLYLHLTFFFEMCIPCHLLKTLGLVVGRSQTLNLKKIILVYWILIYRCILLSGNWFFVKIIIHKKAKSAFRGKNWLFEEIQYSTESVIMMVDQNGSETHVFLGLSLVRYIQCWW